MIRGSTESKGKQEGVGGKWQGVEREGWEGGRRESYCGEGTVTGKRESDDKDARGDNTEHSGTGRWDGGAGRGWRKVQHSSRQ